MIYTLYNPLSNNGHGLHDAEKIKKLIEEPMEFTDVTGINIREFYENTKPQDEIILSGGDGTVNRFLNAIYDIEKGIRIRYFQSGCGNDFARDVREDFINDMIELNPYINNLPLITVKGKKYRFLNGIGYGVDGYCCEKGDEIKKKSKRKINYSLIALRGLLFDYKPANAKVWVDGEEYSFNHVLMAPTMHGRYYGGGVMIAPNQDRKNQDGRISLVVVHDLGKLRALTIFPFIYSGKHTKHTDVVTILEGNDIVVEYDRPAPLQIDGETVSGFTGYRVTNVGGIQ